MALKDVWHAMMGKPASENGVALKGTTDMVDASDMFPVVRLQEQQLSAYKKIPLAGLAAMGISFAQLPESARTVVQTVTKTVGMKGDHLYVGINPKGIRGTIQGNEDGKTGNIMRVNAQGKSVIAGRMRFKPVKKVRVKETTTTVMPIDPTLMVVAAALMAIEKKLDDIQESIENVLQFLKLEKQSAQRGNLNMLSEIMEEYKHNCKNEQFCLSRIQAILAIKKDAHKDILFYQEQIAAELQKQKGIHRIKDSQSLIGVVAYQFAEYQLACYLYAFSSFLDAMLQQNFDTVVIESIMERMDAVAQKYEALYAECYGQIAQYQRSSLEMQAVGGIGSAVKSLGKSVSAVPIIGKGHASTVLINAGESIGKFKQHVAEQELQTLAALKESRITPFIENLQTIHLLHNEENAMVTDGMDLYLLQSR